MKNVFFLSIAIALCSFNFGYSQETDASASNDFSKWQFRLRGIAVTPDESAKIGTIGGTVDISTSVVPEFDITYFFTKNWAAELILATTNHDVEAVNTAVGKIDLGDVWLLPPTLTAQYHFTELGSFKPYLGAGLNYTIFIVLMKDRLLMLLIMTMLLVLLFSLVLII